MAEKPSSSPRSMTSFRILKLRWTTPSTTDPVSSQTKQFALGIVGHGIQLNWKDWNHTLQRESQIPQDVKWGRIIENVHYLLMNSVNHDEPEINNLWELVVSYGVGCFTRKNTHLHILQSLINIWWYDFWHSTKMRHRINIIGILYHWCRQILEHSP